MRSAAPESDVALRDGSTVHVRPVVPEDERGLQEFYEGLSQSSRVFRFFTAGLDLPRAARGAAHRATGLGLVAVTAASGVIVAHAEYVPYRERCAEIAFAVADAWQGHGVSTVLLGQLADAARAEGIATFTATVMAENHRMADVLRDSGFSVERHARPGELEFTLPTALDVAGRRRFEDRRRLAAVAAMGHALQPASIAVLGSTPAADLVRRNLSTFAGPVHDGEVPDGTELAILATAPQELVAAARVCARAHVRAIVALTEAPGAGEELRAVCRSAGMRVIGPGSLGVATPSFDATLAPEPPPPGCVAFVTQSAAFGRLVVDAAAAYGVGLSAFVSLGDKVDLSGNDVLEYAEQDAGTGAVALYLESFGNPRRFSRIVRRLTRRKPVVVVKAARSGPDEVSVDTLLRQAGVIRTDTIGELLDVCALLSRDPLPAGPRVAIVANGRGPAVACADACAAAGLELTRIDHLPAAASLDDMAAAVARADADAVIAIRAPYLDEPLDGVAERLRMAAGVPVVPVVVHPQGRPPALRSVERAARALGHVAWYAGFRAAPPDDPPELDGVDADRASAIIATGLATGRNVLDAGCAEDLLHCYGIARSARPSVPLGVATDPALGSLVTAGEPDHRLVRLAPIGPREAAAVAASLRRPVADLLIRLSALAAAHPEVAELTLDRAGAGVRLAVPPDPTPPGALDR